MSGEIGLSWCGWQWSEISCWQELGGCVQESGHNLCLCLIFVASLYLFVLEVSLPCFSVVLCARFWGAVKLWGVSAAVAVDAAGGQISTKYYPYKSLGHFSSVKNDLSLLAPQNSTNGKDNFFQMLLSIIRWMTQRSQQAWLCLGLCLFC